MRKNEAIISKTSDLNVLVGTITELDVVGTPLNAAVRIDSSQPYVTTEWKQYEYKSVGDRVTPTVDNNHEYLCMIDGVTGADEPNWAASGDIVDGTVVWRDMGVYDPETLLTAVEFFYHCMPNDVDGGSLAFHVGDKVLVAKEGSQNFIVGFEDLKPRACTFYLRLTFNGFVPAIGGEEITVKNSNYSETKTVAAGGICGPFSGKVGSGIEQIFLDAGSLCKYFAHYVEVPEAEAALHFKPTFTDNGSGGYSLRIDKVAAGTPGIVLHANYVFKKLHDKVLNECNRTAEAIGGKTRSVYLVDFVDLYQLYRTATRLLKFDASDPCVPWCNNMVPDSTSCGEEYVRETRFVYGCGMAAEETYGYGCPGCNTPPADRRIWTSCFPLRGYFPAPFSVSGDTLVILSDEFGRFPGHNPSVVEYEIKVQCQCYCLGYLGYWYPLFKICDDYFTFPRSCKEEHQMVLTPEDRF